MKSPLRCVLLLSSITLCWVVTFSEDQVAPGSTPTAGLTDAGRSISSATAPATTVHEVTSSAPTLTPNASKIRSFDRIFLDTSTGLFWSNVIDYSLTQADGARACSQLNGGSAGDCWRLPTKDELKEVADHGIGAYSNLIGDKGSSLWSQTNNDQDSTHAWVVVISGSLSASPGDADGSASRTSRRPVICVRSKTAPPPEAPPSTKAPETAERDEAAHGVWKNLQIENFNQMPRRLGGLTQLVLTFLPLALIAVNAILGTAILVVGWVKRRVHWSWLVLLPLPGLAACWIVAPAVAYDGNLAFVAFLLIYLDSVMGYFGVLLVAWVIYVILRRKKRMDGVTNPN